MTPGQDSEPELVTVVIPAYNAEATIDETLQSVRAQTHRRLEIIVVDDGSDDRTHEIAEAHARLDQRVRVVRQPNAGVAAARNLGWKLGTAAVFAFVDAGDLWSADKTERQLAAMRAAPGAGLVYSWYVVIDHRSRITLQWEGVEWEGDVLRHLLVNNFIGNGSSAMVTRKALEDAHGFEPALRAAGAGGCEDILFYSRVAEHHRFVCARGYLVGYRQLEANMSSNLPRMLQSWLMVQDEMRGRHPDKQADMDRGFDSFARWLVRRAIQLSQARHLPGLFAIIARRSVRHALIILRTEVPKAISEFHWQPFRRGERYAPTVGARFQIGSSGR